MNTKEMGTIGQLIAEYGIPDPPMLYCPNCGTKLSWDYREVAIDPLEIYNQITGKKKYIFRAKYKCPNKHSLPSNGDIHFSGHRWYYDSVFGTPPSLYSD